jgi:hypothetical protein
MIELVQEQDLQTTSESSLRSLQQSAGSSSAGPEEVSTPKELLAAVQAGSKDIRVRAHMDLTGLDGASILNQDTIPKWKLRSIRVRSFPAPTQGCLLENSCTFNQALVVPCCCLCARFVSSRGACCSPAVLGVNSFPMQLAEQ